MKKTRKFNLLLTEKFGSFYKQRIITISNESNLVDIITFQKNMTGCYIIKNLVEAKADVRVFNQAEEKRKMQEIREFTKDFPEDSRRDVQFYIYVNMVVITLKDNTMTIRNTINGTNAVVYKHGGWEIYYDTSKGPAKIISNGKDGISFSDAIEGAGRHYTYDYNSESF